MAFAIFHLTTAPTACHQPKGEVQRIVLSPEQLVAVNLLRGVFSSDPMELSES